MTYTQDNDDFPGHMGVPDGYDHTDDDPQTPDAAGLLDDEEDCEYDPARGGGFT